MKSFKSLNKKILRISSDKKLYYSILKLLTKVNKKTINNQ